MHTVTAKWTNNRADLAQMIDWDTLSQHDFACNDANGRLHPGHAGASTRLPYRRNSPVTLVIRSARAMASR